MPHFIFIQQISVLNILNMLYNLRFFLFKMPFISQCCLVWFLYYSHFKYRCAKICKKICHQKVNILLKTSWPQIYHIIFYPQNRSSVLGSSWLKTGTSHDCRQTKSRYWVCRTHPVLISNPECQEEPQLQHTCKVSGTGKRFTWWEMWWW